MNEQNITLEKQPGFAPPYVPYQTFQPIQPIRTIPKPTYTKTDRIFAIVAAVCGFLVVKTYIECVSIDPNTGLGLMATAASLAVTLYNFFYCRSLGMKKSVTTTVLFIVSMILSLSFLICDNDYVITLSIPVIFISNAYFSYASYREGTRSVVNNIFRAVVISPFHHLGALFAALFNKREKTCDGGKNFKKALPVIAGAVMSIPLCVIVALLLGSADEAFGSLISFSPDDLIEWIADNIIMNVFILLFSMPLSMYIFSAPFSRSFKMHNEDSIPKSKRTDTRIVPPAMCAAFLSPLAIMYIVFTALQVIHVFTASVLNDPDFTYAEYARSGFFQLCAVAVINLAVISVIMFFAKKNERKVLRVFVVVFCVLTHCLIVTALSKMLLYIDMYGMTPKRIETSVFMVYLFIMFAVLIVKQFKTNISFTKIGYCLAAVVLIAMSFIPVDRFIAQYNIDHYRSGDISWMGYYAMFDLDTSAIPVIAGITPEDGEDAYSEAQNYLRDIDISEYGFTRMTVWNYNVPRRIAAEVLESVMIT